ncbi:hypothetical protein AT258_26020 [Bacillus wiedmannii]|uniref:hypothetical protein n=1 Tax=Bacillus TaxID=1386 RepID=UPI00077AF8B7|nr:hypothetical protein [Bacillus mobilis]KXY73391.1 hypothetical protein AT258_26020 [Bacillus wiedmannii]
MNKMQISLDDNGHLILSSIYRYDFIKINYTNTLLNDVVFMFRTIISETDEDKGNILVDIVDEKRINAIRIAEHTNSFIHILQDTNFEGNHKEITETIELVKYDCDMCNKICTKLRNQRYYDNSKKEKCEPGEIKYLLFQEYDTETINNIFTLELAPIFTKQLDVWYYGEKCEDSSKEGTQDQLKYWYDLYLRSEFEWWNEILQFKYLPSRDMKPLKYKPNFPIK